jgi:tetratricopeptide (TPR) repeat protein
MKRSLKAALLAAPFLFVLQSCACSAEPAAQQIAFNTTASAVDAIRTQARALFVANQYVQAANQYTIICRSQSVTANDYYWLGESQYHVGAYADAARSFNYALQMSPSTEIFYPRLADTYMALSRFDRLHEICAVGLGLVKDPYVRSQLQSLSQFSSFPAAQARRSTSKSQRSLRVE